MDAKIHTLNHVFGGIELEKVLPPLQFTFQEHLLQDEAALVHTKKVSNIRDLNFQLAFVATVKFLLYFNIKS